MKMLKQAIISTDRPKKKKKKKIGEREKLSTKNQKNIKEKQMEIM